MFTKICKRNTFGLLKFDPLNQPAGPLCARAPNHPPAKRRQPQSPGRRQHRRYEGDIERQPRRAHTGTRARMPNHIWPRAATDSTYGQCQCVADIAKLHAPRSTCSTRRTRELVRF